MKEFETPRALDVSEIPMVVAAYRKGAENAKKAGFDGVEVHGANGYLLDQFLQDKTNRRDDDYGGPIENRARLMLEVTDACIAVWGASRVGMHLAPRRDAHDMGDSDPLGTFAYVARELGSAEDRLHLRPREARRRQPRRRDQAGVRRPLHRERAVLEGRCRAGARRRTRPTPSRSASSTSPTRTSSRRFREDAPLNAPRPETFYAPGPEGYVDYPALDAALRLGLDRGRAISHRTDRRGGSSRRISFDQVQ